jgi:hypothetical protein
MTGRWRRRNCGLVASRARLLDTLVVASRALDLSHPVVVDRLDDQL